jgi:hypothetical protein
MTSKTTHSTNECLLNMLQLHVSRGSFAANYIEKNERRRGPDPLAIWSVDVCTVPHSDGFVLFCEEYSLFTFINSCGYRRSLAPVLERFQGRREELARELGVSGLAPFSSATLYFGKRTNRYIIGSQNNLMYLMRSYLQDAVAPLEDDLLRKIERLPKIRRPCPIWEWKVREAPCLADTLKPLRPKSPDQQELDLVA